MMFSLAATVSVTASAESSGDFEYSLLADGTFEVTGYLGSAISLEIPSKHNLIPVTSIGFGAFSECSFLESVTIPDSITNIGFCAFSNCSSLESITIPNSVTKIDGNAFSKCTGLTSITIPDSVQSIGGFAFDKCTSLIDAKIGKGVSSMGERIFSGCTSLANIEVSANNQVYSSIDGVVFNKDKTTLLQYPIGRTDKTYNIPDGVQSIGEWAFENCTALTEVTMGDSVQSIEKWAFENCKPLKSITFGKNVSSIGNLAFYNCTSLESIELPYGIEKISDSTFYDCTALTSVTIPSSVNEIGWCAFGYLNEGQEINPSFSIICGENSAAEKYAIENGMYYRTTAFAYGDANNDGTVNMLDVLLIRKYIAKQPVKPNLKTSDVTDDGNIDMLDVLLIRKYIAKQPVILGPKG